MNVNYIVREDYLEKIKPYVDKNIIKVLVGQRRVGKSYLLMEVRDYLVEEKKYLKENILFINKEFREFSFLNNYDDLFKYIDEKSLNFVEGHKKALFLDEIQDIEGFEKVLRSLQAEQDWDIYISGSNANILSSELSTFLSGRYIEIEVFPLSYSEFLKFHQLEETMDSFVKYYKFGGMPYLKNLELKDEVVYPYLKNVYDSIVLKDVVGRYSLRNVAFLESLVLFVSDNVGSVVSAKSISDYLRKDKLSISPSVVINYLSYLTQVYMLMKVNRKLIGKKILEIGEKYYFNDLGIRNAVYGYEVDDICKVMENLVYLELRRRGYRVFVGYDDVLEVDFVAEKDGKKLFVQVSYLLSETKTIDREFGNLINLSEVGEKLVVTLDDAFVKLNAGNYKGVDVVNCRDFLLGV